MFFFQHFQKPLKDFIPQADREVIFAHIEVSWLREKKQFWLKDASTFWYVYVYQISISEYMCVTSNVQMATNYLIFAETSRNSQKISSWITRSLHQWNSKDWWSFCEI